MAIAFGAGSLVNSSGYVNSLTDSSLNVTGTDLVLVTCIVSREIDEVSGITHNSTALTKRASSHNDNVCGAEIWTLADPATGTNDIVCSLANYKLLSMYSFFLTGAVDYEAVDQTNTGWSENPSNSITTASANAWIVDALNLQNAKTISVDGSQTERNNSDHSDGNLGQFGVSTLPKATAGSQAMGWSWTTGDNWAHCAISISEAAAAATSDIKSINAAAIADVKSLNSIAIADVKSVNAITN